MKRSLGNDPVELPSVNDTVAFLHAYTHVMTGGCWFQFHTRPQSGHKHVLPSRKTTLNSLQVTYCIMNTYTLRLFCVLLYISFIRFSIDNDLNMIFCIFVKKTW